MDWPKGSKWRKWDLHVHSPASAKFSGDWNQFIPRRRTVTDSTKNSSVKLRAMEPHLKGESPVRRADARSAI